MKNLSYDSKPQSLNTLFFLMAQYGPMAVIPLDLICRDYFSHLPPDKFLRKASLGELPIPIIRMEGSQKCHKGVHILDLAGYIDSRRDAATKEYHQMHGVVG
ncbi:pyocin activator PrtN family protein [Phyllobacterium bourgognense]|uniref:Pyocin activator protein PrtN n=1 Tax=Phyllobacterium bourgognense TaxID=314236 RepID=A0A368YL34_9HYPH|nr:pyocin activator PrtN family protein [Phyllobacterium bourgognense]RCW80940.1 pyocin activator protein PrtN [Phyllobacterium bourgognense]